MKNKLLFILVLAGMSVKAQGKIGRNITSVVTDVNLQVEATNGQQVVVKKSNGNVGIGTTDPLTPLHLKAVSSTSTDVQELRIASSANSANNKIGFKQRIGFYGRAEYTGAELYNAGIEVLFGDNIHYPLYPGSSSTNMLFLTGNRDTGVATERMRIDYNGRVGIGLSNPSVKLEVNGAIKVGTETIATPTAGMIRFNTATSTFEGYDGTAWISF